MVVGELALTLGENGADDGLVGQADMRAGLEGEIVLPYARPVSPDEKSIIAFRFG